MNVKTKGILAFFCFVALTLVLKDSLKHNFVITVLFLLSFALLLAYLITKNVMSPLTQMADDIQKQFKQLEGEKTTLQSLLYSMIDGLIVLDDKLLIRLLNPSAERALRTKSTTAAGKSLESVWPLKEVHELVSKSLREGTISSRDVSLRYNDLKIYVIPMFPVTGAKVMLIFRDITELRRLEQSRIRFLGQVSHELRTPLAIVKGYVVTLIDDPRLSQAPDIIKILTKIEEEADRLTQLVEQLLELSKLKSEKSTLAYAPFSMKELVTDTVEGFRYHADRYKIGIEYICDENLPHVVGDPRQLKQVLLNLLDNAMKYSPQGKNVEVILYSKGNGVVLKILDHGSGIPKVDLPNIFEQFFQGRKKSEGKGWGLGLPIVKEIVEAHGGRIDVKSQEKLGTEVTVTLPGEGLREQTIN